MLTSVMDKSQLENKLALIVEDDAHNLMALGSLLRGFRIAFKRNTTGANVVQQIRNMRPRPDFILLDMDLPQGDPFEIYDKLRADVELRVIPVIAIADKKAMAEWITIIKEIGFDGFITKPIDQRDFQTVMQAIFRF
jgi:CheY-like chemotaxis protein